ncbi:MAG: type II toxin-antitoxin system VapC family toxin [Acidobacteriaceae bacterium]
MVIDTSAIAAIFLNEPECPLFGDLIVADQVRLISAVSVAETGIVLEARLGAAVAPDFERYVRRIGIEIVAVDGDLAWRALAAWRKYGKGRHPASLNLGDCFSYALAKWSGEPLLARGNDFSRTDIKLCSQRTAN